MTDVDVVHDEDSLTTALWFLVANGWTFERQGRLRCACGAALYELHEMDRQRGDPSASASPAGPA